MRLPFSQPPESGTLSNTIEVLSPLAHKLSIPPCFPHLLSRLKVKQSGQAAWEGGG